jgi:hypothetical protein
VTGAGEFRFTLRYPWRGCMRWPPGARFGLSTNGTIVSPVSLAYTMLVVSQQEAKPLRTSPGGDWARRCQRVPVVSARTWHNVSPGPTSFSFGSDQAFRRITGRLRSSCRHTANSDEPGHNHAAAPYTSPVDASGAANTVPQAPGASARAANRMCRCPVRTGRRKLQELPSCQFRGHLSRRHARKVPLGRWIGQ